MYQQIEFIDGRNPYVCKTDRDFKRMKERYELELIKEGFWKATFKKGFLVTGWVPNNTMAAFSKQYQTKSGAMRRIKKAIDNMEFKSIMLRYEESYLRNNENLEISTSTPVKCWELNGETYNTRIYN